MAIKICIVLCTYNGQRYLHEQLQSIASQTHQNWVLVASDDGSTDETSVILKNFKLSNPEKVILLQGPKKGFALNFVSALRKSPEADVYAFCDQDDIWKPNKLQVIAEAYRQKPEGKPFFFVSAYTIFGLGSKEKIVLPTSKAFLEVFFQHLAPGNVMAFDLSFRKMFQVVEGYLLPDVAHDKLLSLFALGAGAWVYVCPESLVNYRQHESNTIGTGGFVKRAMRFFNRLIVGGGLVPAGYVVALCSVIDALDSESKHKVQALSKLLRRELTVRERMLFARVCLESIPQARRYLVALLVIISKVYTGQSKNNMPWIRDRCRS